MAYRQHYSTRQTPQSEPIPGRDMTKNSAGGYTFVVDDWARLDRFLILGSEGGTYYVSERKLTVDNAQAVTRCIAADGPRVVARVVEISTAGRAPKNDPALFVLAMCAGTGDLETRRAAFDTLPRVARIGTHLFHFLEYVEGFRGWGRGLRRAVANWYNSMPVDDLAYQVVKYQQRDGWSHRDALRLAHPKVGASEGASRRNDLYKWIVGKPEASCGDIDLVAAYEHAKVIKTKSSMVSLIRETGLTREMIPNKWLNDPAVWSALLKNMPLAALIRNLGKMTQVGLLTPMGSETLAVAAKLTDQAYIKKSRLHPLAILTAMKIYAQGHGMKGNLNWWPAGEIIDALDEAFYLAFNNVKPTGKRLLMGLDVSGSMSGSHVAGSRLTLREACGAMALITARTESNYAFVAFDTRSYPLTISPRQRLDDVVNLLAQTGGGGTDCSLPIEWAANNGIDVDAFIILTDSQTWYGSQHPMQALEGYRRQANKPTKLAAVAMASNESTIGDVEDANVVDVAGFDTATPQILADFVRG